MKSNVLILYEYVNINSRQGLVPHTLPFSTQEAEKEDNESSLGYIASLSQINKVFPININPNTGKTSTR